MYNVNARIESVISQRLKLNTNQRNIERYFGAEITEISQVKNKSFLSTFLQWDKLNQDKFISILGGPVNSQVTRDYLEELIEGFKISKNVEILETNG